MVESARQLTVVVSGKSFSERQEENEDDSHYSLYKRDVLNFILHGVTKILEMPRIFAYKRLLQIRPQKQCSDARRHFE